MQKPPTVFSRNLTPAALASTAACLLSACGGGSPSPAASTASVAVHMEVPAPATSVVEPQALPMFHVAPVVLAEPDDAGDPIIAGAHDGTSAKAGPHVQGVPVELSTLSTRRLTLERIRLAARYGAGSVEDAASAPNPTPLATGTVVATYSPAQIRSAYSLPPLPASVNGLTAAQAAQLGAGQTIYIVDAQHDPNAAAELATFNQKFALPGCNTVSIAANAVLPLAAPSPTAGCTFSIVYSGASGGMTASAPSYDSGWATEIALDVQWAHATAPMARIVLIEAPDASVSSLMAGVSLANSMGPGIVSMSFGSPEGGWTAQTTSAFTGAKMTYLAAAGDAGAAVEWPAVLPQVVAVGGTTLSYPGSGPRSETVWSGTGGGISQYTATPSYQTAAVPGLGNPGRRAVTDVSFNADPASGQYLAVIAQGSTTTSWMSVGGTSLSTPQWAGIIAIANALRAQASKPVLGAPHSQLYGAISTVPTTYASAFADVTTGSDGSCATCSAKVGYDLPTGLGTPNVTSLLAALGGSSAASGPPAPAPITAPVVASSSVSAVAGTALNFPVSVTSANPVTWTLTGALSGMSINTAGVLSWPNPVAGTYAVTANARDTKTGLSGSGVLSISVTAPQPPVVQSASITGRTGVALSYAVAVKSANPLTYMLSGAPAGVQINGSGVIGWPAPVPGTYPLTVIATDTRTGLSGRGTVTVNIVVSGPVISASAMSGVAGKPLTATIGLADATSSSLSVAISGIPAGMALSLRGTAISVSWPSPVTGKYTLSVVARDSNGQVASAGVPVTITAH